VGAGYRLRSFFSVLSFGKCWNALLVYLGYLFSRWGWIQQPWGLPLSMSIEPTTACNLGCPECPSGLKSFERATGNLKLADFESWVSDWRKHLLYLNFYFQGEPFIHPKLLAMIAKAKENKIFTAVSTNGHFLDDANVQSILDSRLDRIIISLDGFTQEVYEQYRVNGNVNEVMQGVHRLVSARKERGLHHPEIIVQMLVVKPNEKEIPLVEQWVKEVGADELRLKTAQLYQPKDQHPLMPEQEQYRRYRRTSTGQWEIKNKLDNHCWRMWSGCVITWDGKVVPCCFDKDAKYVMGNLKTAALPLIWKQPAYQQFRLRLQNGRKEIDICANCSEGTKVWA
jgi:radical SAM protein with 4Fe4S-binding SPASM domain